MCCTIQTLERVGLPWRTVESALVVWTEIARDFNAQRRPDMMVSHYQRCADVLMIAFDMSVSPACCHQVHSRQGCDVISHR